MEAVQNKSIHDMKKSNSAVSCINETNIDELSKEKDELLFGTEEDEDVLSDDSLRLRLSDDEDAEQEDITKNHKNVSEFISSNKNPEQPSEEIITEKKSSSDPQQVVEDAIKSGSEEPTPKEPNSAINNLPENSALLSDEYTSENKSAQNNVLHNNLENSIVVTANKLNEKCTLNIRDKVKSDCCDNDISQVTNNTKSKMQLNHIDDDENTIDVKILNNDFRREDSVIKCTFDSTKDEDVKITEENNVCEKATSEENILKNDHLPINNLAETSSCRDVELTNDSEGKLKTTGINKCNEIISANICNSNNLDIACDYDHLINSAKIKICNVEKSSTITAISNDNKCDDTLRTCSDNVIEPVTLKRLLTENNNDHDSTDISRSDSSDDNFSNKYKRKMENLEHESITQTANISKTQFVQKGKNIAPAENQSDSSDVIDTTEEVNKDRDKLQHTNTTITDIADTNSTSTKLTSVVPISMEDNESDDTITIIRRRKRLKKVEKINTNAVEDCIIEEDMQEKQEAKDSGRQKRKTARNAEEIIRRNYARRLNSDSDSTNSDNEELSAASSYKSNKKASSASPVSLKRNCPDNENILFNGTVKKMKMAKSEQTNVANDIMKLSFVEKFCQRNIKEKLPKLTQEQLEELLIQKIVETLTMRSEIGLLREQARVSERNQEVTRVKLQQLAKQVKDFEMVLSRNVADRRTNPDKAATPIKINRSVGLQVNFITEHGMQNLRQIQQTSQQKTTNALSNVNVPTSVPEPVVSNSTNSSPKRGIKIRSPRRSEASTAPSNPAISQNSMHTSPLISTVTPAALVVAKPVETQQTLTLPNSSSSIQQILTGNIPQQQQQIQSQAYVVSNKVQNQVNRSNSALIKPKSSDLIDLTDEEEKSKSAKIIVTSAPSLIEQQLSTAITSKPVQCFPRVIQTIPTNVAITAQQASIRVVQPNQPVPTATIVNNGAPPRLAYVMQGSVGATRQLLITSNASQIRPITTCRVTTSFPTVTYKTGTSSTIANGTVRVLTTPAVSSIQMNKHPAPLPETPNYTLTPGWKLPPPAPSLKMSKVPNGIVLSWNMQLTDKYADIVSYQLYAYQEVAGVTPSTSLWKKVGDVRALPLPMACTLTQFSEGNNYYFAVRAVDIHSRKGQYSMPGNISL